MDGFAGLRGTGAFISRSVLCTGPVLRLTADVVAAGGSVSVGLAGGGAAGLSVADASPIVANTTDGAMVFHGGKDFRSLVGKQVTLDIEIKDAMLFTVGFFSK